jgi:hypothetical protein
MAWSGTRTAQRAGRNPAAAKLRIGVPQDYPASAGQAIPQARNKQGPRFAKQHFHMFEERHSQSVRTWSKSNFCIGAAKLISFG